jgi:hypothetical protein
LKKTELHTIAVTGSDGLTVTNPVFGGNAAITTTLSLPQDLRITASPTFVEVNSTCDENLKRDITPVGRCIDKLTKIEPKRFNWRIDGLKGNNIGLIAQDLEKEFPAAVTEVNGHKRVCHTALIALLFGAVRDLKAELAEIKRSA